MHIAHQRAHRFPFCIKCHLYCCLRAETNTHCFFNPSSISMNAIKILFSNFILLSFCCFLPLFPPPPLLNCLFSVASFKSTSCAFPLDTHSHILNYAQGLKRSVTTLRGGSLGYAEIVAVKVLNRSRFIDHNNNKHILFGGVLFFVFSTTSNCFGFVTTKKS